MRCPECRIMMECTDMDDNFVHHDGDGAQLKAYYGCEGCGRLYHANWYGEVTWGEKPDLLEGMD